MNYCKLITVNDVVRILILCCSLLTCGELYSNQASSLQEEISGRYELKNTVQKELIQFPLSNDSISNKNNYVSIAQLDDEHYAIANYGNLFLLNGKTNQVCVLKPIGLASLGGEEKTSLADKLENNVYMPTGVFIDHNKELYVANYKGNNILEGTVNISECEIRFVKIFSSANTKGPENISVDDKNNILVSANYDAGTVTAFNLKDGKELWSTNIGQAHGVAISDDRVYVTGLFERKIYVLLLHNGKIVKSRGSIGWNPMQSQFLWPTSIYPYHESMLVVSDAQSGFISFINKKSLKTIKYTGGNGPSYNWFNYPYTTYPTKNGLIVLSSMRGNILFLNASATQVEKNLISFEDHWPHSDYANSYFGIGWDSYVNVNGPTVKVRNQDYRLGFGHLHPVVPGPILRVPDINTLYNLGGYIYFLQGIRDGDSNYVFSSSSTTLLGIENGNKVPDVLVSWKINLDSWLYKKDLINVHGEAVTESVLKRKLDFHAKGIYSQLHKNQWISPQMLYELNDFSDQTRKISYEEFVRYLDALFVSPIGKVFKKNYDLCNQKNCDIKKLKRAATDYYWEVKQYSYLNLDEFILVGMLSGVSSEDQSNLIDYDNCGLGKYYNNYGINALKTKTFDDYLSAYDLNSSYVCFSHKEKKKFSLKMIRFFWYSDPEIPKKIAVYGLATNSAREDKVLLGEYQIASHAQLNGYTFSDINIGSSQLFNRYIIKLLEGGTQNRLLVRSIEPVIQDGTDTFSKLSLLNLADDVNRRMVYGSGANGTNIAFKDCNSEEIARYLLSSESAHCGNFAYVFVYSLPSSFNWTVYDLRTSDHRVHTVVEVTQNKNIQVVDPTLGVIYPCNLEALLDGTCNYAAVEYLQAPHQMFTPYFGKNFFHGAEIIGAYRNMEDLNRLYCVSAESSSNRAKGY